ncbi:MAG TPA: SDR family NAD(P)-dependent oxidoreductase, partial [Blastocatellia bacterium]|nr:SDR family NAD(P)-dependent oxidoreductase [Blastocatellia bacterium]
MGLDGKVAIVTGATRGIGRAIALELARNGCQIGFNYIQSHQHARSLNDEVETLGGRSMPFQVDVRDLPGVKKMVEQVKQNFGKIDFLINNAGILRDKAF